MDTLRLLFYKCAYTIHYENVGHDVSYAFEETDDTLYIYFQGSHSVMDWLRNFLFTEKLYKQFRVHRGFYEAYKEVRNILLDKVYAGNYKKIVIVGYSHGGALAYLTHEDMVYHFPNIEVVSYAFESPRCLKVPKEYRHLWKDFNIIRTNNDLITHLPPAFLGYRHLGTMIKTKGDTRLVDKNLPKCIKSHYPQVVLDGLKNEQEKMLNAENGGKVNTKY